MRENDKNLLYYGRLLQQHIVDCYCKIESQRPSSSKFNQSTIGADLYQNYKSAINGDSILSSIGTKIILPSSFVGGEIHIHQCY